MGTIILQGNTLNMPFMSVPDKYKNSRLRDSVVMNDEPTSAFYPAKFLPVSFKDVSTGDYVVIPKGTLVSAMGPTTSGTTIPSPSASGTIPVYNDVTTGSIVTVNIDDSFWGYPDGIAGLIIPANGGASSTYTYGALDVEAGIYKIDKTQAASGDTLVLAANKPLGIVTYDIYADSRGQHLNYYEAFNNPLGIVRNAYIRIPYVDTTLFDATYSKTFSTIYSSMYPIFSFLYDTTDNLQIGNVLKSDLKGKFVVDTSAPTVQSVGRLHVLDCRFPKDLLEYTDTYPGSHVTGTDTGGIPAGVFIFAYTAIYASEGSYPTINEVVTAVKQGIFGYAYIQLSL